MAPALALAPEPSSSWRAWLALDFVRAGERTEMRRRGQHGPLAIQRPFYPEGPGVCHVVILHPPAGLVPGDSLSLEVDVRAGAHALITTPAATKVYRSDGRIARQTQTLRAADRAMVEWLPHESILFEGARAQMQTRVELCGGASFIGWDVLCLGRRAAGEHVFGGECRQHIELWRDGHPLLVERSQLDGETQAAPWGLRQGSVLATVLAWTPALDDESTSDLLAQLRATCLGEGELSSATVVSGVLVCRYLGNDATRARILIESAWRILRPRLAGRAACPPRIWST